MGIKPAIRVKETARYKVGHPLRKEAKIFWQKWGRDRYLKIGSHFRVKNEEIAQKRGIAAFVLYNMYLLIIILFYISVLLKTIFRIASLIQIIKGDKVIIITNHPMTKKHYIVRHTLVTEKGDIIGERTFYPEDKRAESQFRMPKGYKGILFATSFCNLHDFWITKFKV